MAKRQKMQSWESDISNNGTFDMYFNRLKDYALSMFEWEGLPDTVNKRFLELIMFEEGRVVFFNHRDLGFMVAPVLETGRLNHYREPISWRAVGIELNEALDDKDSVIMWNNYGRTPLIPIIRAYAYRLYQVEKTMDVNINSQKYPILILADESQRLTLQNAYMQYEGNEPFIFGNKSGFDKDAFQVLNTGAPFVTDKLMEYKHNLWNEVMTFLGVGNAKQDKKERLVSAEVSANDEQIQTSRHTMLQARLDACEKINQLFSMNIAVDYKLNVERKEKEVEAGDGLLQQSNSESK